MPATSAAIARPRRSQHERRAATRQALLDAMLACLLEDGYAGLTTRRVATRAGVSAATQRFYFPSRAAFVAAAVKQLAVELTGQQVKHPLRSAPAPERFRAWLDELWEICNGPAFHAVVELAASARTDPVARESFADAERALTRQIALSAADLFPDELPNPRFPPLVELATASMRGLAMFGPVSERNELDGRWGAVRDVLMRLHDDLIDGTAAAERA